MQGRDRIMVGFVKLCLWSFRFAVGACVFSFLNVVIYRLPAGESMVKGRSHCMTCGKILGAKELIPCISYLMQRGRCAGCKSKISSRYFLVEMLGGLLFVHCGDVYGCGTSGLLSVEGLIAFGYMCILAVIAFIDWDTKIIYDRFHVMIFILGFVSMWLYPQIRLKDRLIGAVVIALPMFLMALFIEGAFGGGDIKLMAASGFLLGVKGIVCGMFLGILTGGIYCIGMVLLHKLDKKASFAFGPFLAVGLAVAYFYGETMVNAYLSLL